MSKILNKLLPLPATGFKLRPPRVADISLDDAISSVRAAVIHTFRSSPEDVSTAVKLLGRWEVALRKNDQGAIQDLYHKESVQFLGTVANNVAYSTPHTMNYFETFAPTVISPVKWDSIKVAKMGTMISVTGNYTFPDRPKARFAFNIDLETKTFFTHMSSFYVPTETQIKNVRDPQIKQIPSLDLK